MSIFNDVAPSLAPLPKEGQTMMKFVFPLLVALVLPIQPSFAQQQPSIPTMSADESHVTDLSKPIEPEMKGFGTRAVEGRTLDEMLRNCDARRESQSAVEKARCEQLVRTLKNQPGNTSAPS